MRDQEMAPRAPALLSPVVKGSLTAMLTLMAGSIVATITIFLGWDWAAHLHVVGLTVALAAVALGSVMTGLRAGARGLLVGLLTGLVFSILAYLLCLLLGLKEMVPALAALRIAAACGIGAIGGMLGVNLSR